MSAAKWLLGLLGLGGVGAAVAVAVSGDDDDDAGGELPKPPVPHPDGPDQAGGPLPPPANLVRLQAPKDFEAFNRIIEGNGKPVPAHRGSVVLGHASGWAGLGDTMAELDAMARANPGVLFIHFRTWDSFEAIGKPDTYLAYVVTAVDRAGNLFPHPRMSTDPVSPPIGAATLAALLEWAASDGVAQPPEPPPQQAHFAEVD